MRQTEHGKTWIRFVNPDGSTKAELNIRSGLADEAVLLLRDCEYATTFQDT